MWNPRVGGLKILVFNTISQIVKSGLLNSHNFRNDEFVGKLWDFSLFNIFKIFNYLNTDNNNVLHEMHDTTTKFGCGHVDKSKVIKQV